MLLNCDASPTVVLEKTLESPLDCKEIQQVHPKGDKSWVFIGRTDVEAETPILWPPDAKNWLMRKDLDAGKDWRWEKKGIIRGWDGWMASLTRWTWVWVSYGSWWGTRKPGVLQSMGVAKSRTRLSDGTDWCIREERKKPRSGEHQQRLMLRGSCCSASCPCWSPCALSHFAALFHCS